jgi:dienelactone hydrolase
MSLGGCRDMTPRATRTAAGAGLTLGIVQGTTYQHTTFARGGTAGPLYVFIEGDGSPWVGHGTRVADDPTPHHPLALELAAQTSGPILYLGRPCYFQARTDAACRAPVWTSARYSKSVVESMAAVIKRSMAAYPSRPVVLIGYSGGGVLAVLIAPLIPASAVVTIAANLDVDAWTRWHHYAALTGSLNPATQPQLAHIQEWHLVGDRDQVAPPSLSQAYLDRLDPSHVWHYPSFDHVCCWAEKWPAIFSHIQAATHD